MDQNQIVKRVISGGFVMLRKMYFTVFTAVPFSNDMHMGKCFFGGAGVHHVMKWQYPVTLLRQNRFTATLLGASLTVR